LESIFVNVYLHFKGLGLKKSSCVYKSFLFFRSLSLPDSVLHSCCLYRRIMKSKPVILLVDDDEDDHHIFNTAMQSAALQCEMHNAFNAEEALSILESVTPDFIFLDMHMPRVDGIEFLLRLQKLYAPFTFKVVMFSTGMTKELCDKATEKGASYCVKKPASIAELEKVLVQVCISKTTPSKYLF